MQSETNIPAAPAGYATVNPFVITHDANGLIDFLKQVFRATERPRHPADGDAAAPGPSAGHHMIDAEGACLTAWLGPARIT